MLLPVVALGQETERPAGARGLLSGLRAEVSKSEASLKALLDVSGIPAPDALGVIGRRLEDAPSRGPSRDAGGFFAVDFTLEPDSSLRVKDSNGTVGLVLTGKWISDYARHVKLVPEYERLLEAHRKQAELNGQLVSELEGALEIKDQKIGVLVEIRDAERARADLYKTIAEVKGESLLEKIWKKLAFPAGLAIGVAVGVVVAQ